MLQLQLLGVGVAGGLWVADRRLHSGLWRCDDGVLVGHHKHQGQPRRGAARANLRRFDCLVEKGRTLARQGEHAWAALALVGAVELGRGPALADIGKWAAGRAQLARFEAGLRAAEELLVEQRLAAGQDVVSAARALADAQPLREQRW